MGLFEDLGEILKPEPPPEPPKRKKRCHAESQEHCDKLGHLFCKDCEEYYE